MILLQSTPDVSFLVPCFNYGRYLRDCLDSILGQTGTADFEVVAIDDASTDETAAVLASYRDPRLRVLTHRVNRGHVATMTEGLGETRGRHVARIDPDDRYRPGFLSATLDKLEAHAEVGLVYGDAAIIDDQGRVTQESRDRRHGGRDFRGNEFVALLEENFVSAPTVIARREAWLEGLPVPAGLAFNDWYFTVEIARRWNFYYVHRVLADYRVHAANHHARIVRDRTEEPSVFQMLDRVFAGTERRPELDAVKRRARHRVYGAHYLTLARKYLGHGMYEDARRCYIRALRHRPALAMAPGVARQLAGTLVGQSAYEGSKAAVRHAFRLLSRG